MAQSSFRSLVVITAQLTEECATLTAEPRGWVLLHAALTMNFSVVLSDQGVNFLSVMGRLSFVAFPQVLGQSEDAFGRKRGSLLAGGTSDTVLLRALLLPLQDLSQATGTEGMQALEHTGLDIELVTNITLRRRTRSHYVYSSSSLR